jgi:hypothetical protein
MPGNADVARALLQAGMFSGHCADSSTTLWDVNNYLFSIRRDAGMNEASIG